MSSNITLIVIPGPGARTVSVEDNTTVAQLVSSENLHGRDIIINGEGIPATAYQTSTIPAGAEVFATGSVKGNNDARTLVVIPGPGARNISYSSDTTIADLVSRENLHGRDIILDGRGVPATEWQQTTLGNTQEIFATGSVKGN